MLAYHSVAFDESFQIDEESLLDISNIDPAELQDLSDYTALMRRLGVDAQAIERGNSPGGSVFMQNQWATLLTKYVDEEGFVDYIGMKKEEAALDNYLDHLGSNPPTAQWTKEAILVYYINLYNAATIKLILDHYPVNSILDIKTPWKRKWIKVGTQTLSLHYIEHEVLRKKEEPRIHFAINCASYSCPKLLNLPYAEDTLEKQLQTVTNNFINDSTKNRIASGKLKLSKLFKWYKSDFEAHGTLKQFLQQFTQVEISPNAKITFRKYDWKLNEANKR